MPSTAQAAAPDTLDAATAADERPAGDLAIWFVIGAELLTFALLFTAFAFQRARHVAAFNEAQQTLNRNVGAINTVLLISGSWCVARAVRAATLGGDAGRQVVGRWLLGALACGAGFLTLKWHEYTDKWGEGFNLATSDFSMFYYLLTGFHFLHVVAAMVILAVLAAGTQRVERPTGLHALETGAAFWHMVDLLWIVLFPLVYVMR